MKTASLSALLVLTATLILSVILFDDPSVPSPGNGPGPREDRQSLKMGRYDGNQNGRIDRDEYVPYSDLRVDMIYREGPFRPGFGPVFYGNREPGRKTGFGPYGFRGATPLMRKEGLPFPLRARMQDESRAPMDRRYDP